MLRRFVGATPLKSVCRRIEKKRLFNHENGIDNRDLHRRFKESHCMFEYAKHCDAIRLMRCKTMLQFSSAIKRRPLQKRNMVALAKKIRFTEKQCAMVLGISQNSYNKLTLDALISIRSSEMVLRLAELFEIGTTTFDDRNSFINWLRASVPALEGVTPLSLLSSRYGFELVKDLLLRMEYSASN